MKEIVEYAGRTYTNGGGVKFNVENKEMSVVPEPTKLDVDKLDATDKRIWEK
jgi:hypothetical protein